MNCKQQQQHYKLNHRHTWLPEEVLCPLNQVTIESLPPDVLTKYGCGQQLNKNNEVHVTEESTESAYEVFSKEDDKKDNKSLLQLHDDIVTSSDQNPNLAVKVEKFCQTLSEIFNNGEEQVSLSGMDVPIEGVGDCSKAKENDGASSRENEKAAKLHICSVCDKQFSCKSNLTQHKRTHTGVKPFTCSQCSKRFSRSSHLKLHFLTHIGEKSHSCTECEYSCYRKGHLVRHMRTHTGVKPFKCPHCVKSFTTSDNLKTHIRTHTGEKPFLCSECSYSCAHKGHLNIHMRTHSGQKPYTCDICKKCFSQRVHLTVHRRVHTGDKPYKCSICNKGFSRSSDRTRHFKSCNQTSVQLQ